MTGAPSVYTSSCKSLESWFSWKKYDTSRKIAVALVQLSIGWQNHISSFTLLPDTKQTYTSSWKLWAMFVVSSQWMAKARESLIWSRMASLMSWDKSIFRLTVSFDSDIWEILFALSFSRTSSAAQSRLCSMRDSPMLWQSTPTTSEVCCRRVLLLSNFACFKECLFVSKNTLSLFARAGCIDFKWRS